LKSTQALAREGQEGTLKSADRQKNNKTT